MKRLLLNAGGALLLLVSTLVCAEEQTVDMHAVSETGVGDAIGQITIKEIDDGLAFFPELEGLSAGLHGFHVHENPDCAATGDKREPASAAGGHYDPEATGAHKAPWEEGHRGDLPALYVDEDHQAQHPVFVHDLELKDIQGRALMIHEGGDNYADEPEPLGGGGKRVACGIIQR